MQQQQQQQQRACNVLTDEPHACVYVLQSYERTNKTNNKIRNAFELCMRRCRACEREWTERKKQWTAENARNTNNNRSTTRTITEPNSISSCGRSTYIIFILNAVLRALEWSEKQKKIVYVHVARSESEESTEFQSESCWIINCCILVVHGMSPERY